VYEITVSDEFAAWFEALEEPQAERVVAALEVVAAAGSALDVTKCSPWLLWFDGISAVSAEQWSLYGQFLTAQPVYTELARVHHEAVRWLDSASFQNALRGLDAAQVARASEAVRNLRSVLRATWTGFTRVGFSKAGFVSAGSASRGMESSTELVREEAEALSATELVRAALRAVSAAVGLETIDREEREHGLRELTMTECRPGLRVIYGIDVTARRLLALVGDALTRQYYGDSVRLAERRWREYLERGSKEVRLSTRR
jgi:hypothetical protein